MLLKRNILQCTAIISCGGSLFGIILNYITNISPITGILFHLYMLILFMLSIFFSFKLIQCLLHLNKPISYNFENVLNEYIPLQFLRNMCPDFIKKKKGKLAEEYKEYDTNELSVISTVLEKKLVSSWYVPFISLEISFPFACKQMLDLMIGKTFQICNQIETKELCIDACTILTNHLREYKKALKRQENSNESSVESLYKKSHVISDVTKKITTADYCTNLLRIVLKELIPWELWDTPHSELLIRILSKKLDNFINITLTDPVWLNSKLNSVLREKIDKNENLENGDKDKCEENTLEQEKVISESIPTTTCIESALSTVVTQTVAPVITKNIYEETKYRESQVKTDKAVEAISAMDGSEIEGTKSSPIMRQRRGRQGRNEVKIYDRIIEGSIKTWETDVDLQCISLGQDLLASLNGEMTLSRLWVQDPDMESSPGQQTEKSPEQLWFGEEDAIDIELDTNSPRVDNQITKSGTSSKEQQSGTKETSAMVKEPNNLVKEASHISKEHSPKPAEILRDIQSTVHQAKTKIGDLQDEAAGMMEGLLDFGIAGIKKGLRFTGLSDDSQEKSASQYIRERSERISPPESNKTRAVMEHRDTTTTTTTTTSPLEREDNGNTPHLVKQSRVSSQDSILLQSKSQRSEASAGGVPIPLSESPEPQYEEAADLSTSIAKLRSLLQQRAELSPGRSDEVWWESAEESRGRTLTHHTNSRHIDSATLADEYDMNIERNSSPGHTTNNMQRLDKLLQRTVTGVFNSIRTAVGSGGTGGSDGEVPFGAAPEEWSYVTTPIEQSVCGAVARLLGSRRALAHVDAALDTLEQLPSQAATHGGVQPHPADFEEWCSIHACGWCCGAELMAALGLVSSHVTHRILSVLLADRAETLITEWLEEFSLWLRKQVFVLFEQMSTDEVSSRMEKNSDTPEQISPDEVHRILLKRFPALYVFGEDKIQEAVTLTMESFSRKELNTDVAFRILDVIALHFTTSARLRNPSFDVN